jgi:6,7-dimethyl-8-ribityllumazine synthase
MAGRAPRARRVRPSGRSVRFAIVAARFNERITQRLVQGALQAFRGARLSGDAVEVHWVPGSFELPQAAGHLAATGRYAGIVCVGVVIRGQTPHFEHVAREAAAGIREVALTTGVPATYGVVTALSEEQAWARAGGEVGNRGEEAAEAALAMAEWVNQLRRGPGIARHAKSAGAEPRAPLAGHPRLSRPRGSR